MVPKVVVLALGGTIAMTPGEDRSRGVQPTLTAAALVEAVPELGTVASVEARSFRQVPGPHLTLSDLVALAREIQRVVAAGARGVVITQGTDTIEETAFALDVMLQLTAPVIVTGAMRNPAQPGAEGPANLLAAVRVAASATARDCGVLVVMNDEIHAACLVQKRHTANLAAFRSPSAGPIGWLAEGRVQIVLRPARRLHVPVVPAVGADPSDGTAPGEGVSGCAPDGADRPVGAAQPVALITAGLGDDGRLLTALPGLGYKGLVVEALGAGHVPLALVRTLGDLAQAMPVVLASRTGSGETLRQTYGYPGAEIDLLGRGLIPAGMLDGPKARILLQLLLVAGAERARIHGFFDSLVNC